MKSFVCALLCLFVALVPLSAERINILITLGASPVRIAVGSTKVNRLMIQNRHTSVGLVTVLLGVPPATTCSVSATNPSQISAELGPGDSLHPGASLSDPQGANGNSPSDYEDLSWACVSGTMGDQVIVTAWRRQ